MGVIYDINNYNRGEHIYIYIYIKIFVKNIS